MAMAHRPQRAAPVNRRLCRGLDVGIPCNFGLGGTGGPARSRRGRGQCRLCDLAALEASLSRPVDRGQVVALLRKLRANHFAAYEMLMARIGEVSPGLAAVEAEVLRQGRAGGLRARPAAKVGPPSGAALRAQWATALQQRQRLRGEPTPAEVEEYEARVTDDRRRVRRKFFLMETPRGVFPALMRPARLGGRCGAERHGAASSASEPGRGHGRQVVQAGLLGHLPPVPQPAQAPFARGSAATSVAGLSAALQILPRGGRASSVARASATPGPVAANHGGTAASAHRRGPVQARATRVPRAHGYGSPSLGAARRRGAEHDAGNAPSATPRPQGLRAPHDFPCLCAPRLRRAAPALPAAQPGGHGARARAATALHRRSGCGACALARSLLPHCVARDGGAAHGRAVPALTRSPPCGGGLRSGRRGGGPAPRPQQHQALLHAEGVLTPAGLQRRLRAPPVRLRLVPVVAFGRRAQCCPGRADAYRPQGRVLLAAVLARASPRARGHAAMAASPSSSRLGRRTSGPRRTTSGSCTRCSSCCGPGSISPARRRSISRTS